MKNYWQHSIKTTIPFFQKKKLLRKIKKTRRFKKEIFNYYLEKYDFKEIPISLKILLVTFFCTFSFIAALAELKTNGIMKIGIEMLYPTLLLGVDAFGLRITSDICNDLISIKDLFVFIPFLNKKIKFENRILKIIDNICYVFSYLCFFLSFFSYLFFLFCVVLFLV